MNKKYIPDLRKRIDKKIFTKTDVPIVVYLAVIIAMIVTWNIRQRFEIAGDFFVELFGVAFTLFIIDILLVSSKSKRWKIVQEDVDYLIARNINRLRDGLAIRAFNFQPDVNHSLTIREQQANFLTELESLEPKQLETRLYEAELFSTGSYAYFNERSDDLWDVINMKYAEFLPPILVSQLINLHTHLKDVCGHINQYRKSERFKEDQAYYQSAAIKGISYNLKQILHLVNILKKEGYSEPARTVFEGK
ncbi:MAG: hypothetical protein EA412_00915 [Chitinophagaceae bacterium]|nr:MAG: hypothetical protein EA412_00915 [Chitinophagaceae bacterium]